MVGARLTELDALRGVAATLVVVYHFTAGYGSNFGWGDTHPAFNFTSAQAGVAIFFVLSGFVISLSLERSLSVRDFAASRFSRLCPIFWFACALTTALVTITGFNPFRLTLAGIGSTSTMLDGLLGEPFIDPSYWTLTRELLFYVLLAAVYFTGGRRAVVPAMLAWVAASILYNVTLADQHYFSCETSASCVAIIGNTMFSYLFAAGVMVYRIYLGERSPLIFATLLLCAVASTVFAWPTDHLTLANAGKLIVYAGVVAAAATGWLGILRLRPLVFLGSISYSLYLVHQVIGSYVIGRLLNAGLSANAAIAVAAVCIIALASAMCFGIERPSQRIAMRFYRARFGSVRSIPISGAQYLRP